MKFSDNISVNLVVDDAMANNNNAGSQLVDADNSSLASTNTVKFLLLPKPVGKTVITSLP